MKKKDLFKKYKTSEELFKNESPKVLNQMFPHGKPKTRRQFIKSGLINFTAAITAPTLIQSLLHPQSAHAQACLTKPAFINLKLNGGAAMLGNFVALGANRDYIDTYSQLGLGPRSEIVNRTVTTFGNALFYDASQFLAGMQQTANATTLLNTSFVGIPVASTDDTANNPFGITHFVSKLGVQGSILPNLGRRQSEEGIAQLPALGRTPPTPLAVNNVNDLTNALSVNGSLAVMSEAQKGQVFSLINRLSERQVASLASQTGGQVLQQLVNDATGTNEQLVNSETAGVDPLQDNAVQGQFNTTWNDGNNNLNNQNDNNRERVFASMVYNGLKGTAGTVSLELGGYDYHGNGRANQDAMDLEAGRIMGQIIESAAIMQRPLFLMVTSDGAVGAPGGSAAGAAFTSDRGQGGCIYCIAYHPLARPSAVNRSGAVDHQVGQVRGQAGVDTTFLTGNSPELAGLAAFANFASFSGQTGQFSSIVGGIWNTDQIEEVIRLRRVG